MLRAAMDPALRDYLNQMRADLVGRCNAAVINTNRLMASQEAVVKQLEEQKLQIREFIDWKPDLESRLAKLQDGVTELQRAQPISPHARSGPPPAHLGASSSHAMDEEIHGSLDRREFVLPGGLAAVNTTSPSPPPVTGMTSLQQPMAIHTADSPVVSIQILSGLGSNVPNFPFPCFTGDNPNLSRTLAEQYFTMFAIHESYWVPMSI